MVVNKLFSKVKLPIDEKEINHMINEYDKQMNQQTINITNRMITRSKLGEYFFQIVYFFVGIFILTSSRIVTFSILIKLIYTIPLFTIGAYNIVLDKRINRYEAEDDKLVCKYSIIGLLSMCLLLLNFTVIFQMVLFPKLQDKDYMLILLVLFIACCICVIISKIDSPKRFIKEFVYSERTYKTVTTVSNSTVILAIVILNITKPYRLVMFGSYILIIVLFQIILYILYKYSQYDYIEEL